MRIQGTSQNFRVIYVRHKKLFPGGLKIYLRANTTLAEKSEKTIDGYNELKIGMDVVLESVRYQPEFQSSKDQTVKVIKSPRYIWTNFLS